MNQISSFSSIRFKTCLGAEPVSCPPLDMFVNRTLFTGAGMSSAMDADYSGVKAMKVSAGAKRV